MYLGRIITKSKTVETIEFVDITTDKTLIENCKIPTLVIGKKNIQELIGKENVRFLDKKVSDNLYWTFAKTEQRNEYEKDLKTFNNMIVNRLKNGVQYKYLNIFTESLTKIKAFIKFMHGKSQKVIYITQEMIYVYCKNTVYGVSLIDLQYIGIKRDKIVSKLKKNRYNTLVFNDYFLKNSTKKLINNSKILVPYIFFLENS